MLDNCKLGLVHRWQAAPHNCPGGDAWLPVPTWPCCMCLQALAVQFPEAGRVE